MTDYRTAHRRTNASTLARIRMDRGLTQCQLADRIGCCQKDISRWESGVHTPSTASLMKLAIVQPSAMEELIK